VVIAFRCVVTCRTLWIEARRPFEQGFVDREFPETKFEGKHLEPIAGMEGSGEGCPVVVGPAKGLLHTF
jgi:hypothetical protein